MHQKEKMEIRRILDLKKRKVMCKNYKNKMRNRGMTG